MGSQRRVDVARASSVQPAHCIGRSRPQGPAVRGIRAAIERTPVDAAMVTCTDARLSARKEDIAAIWRRSRCLQTTASPPLQETTRHGCGLCVVFTGTAPDTRSGGTAALRRSKCQAPIAAARPGGTGLVNQKRGRSGLFPGPDRPRCHREHVAWFLPGTMRVRDGCASARSRPRASPGSP